ncbi:MAG TPA: vWA domain-containing protein [Thermoanaerobaculia bacterium]
MKRILLVVLVCLLPLSALGSEAFILDIPLRFNTQQETGDAKVLLELSAAPTGSQLVVNNGTTLNLGDTNVMIAGDSVSFTAGSAANTALIEYKPLSNFSGDFCNAVATEKQIPMRFAGAQDITGYRVATYIVASPAAECSQVSKHTGDTPAFLTPNDDGVAPALDADYKGRFTYDVALVLDKSGSMSELPPGANGGPTKIEYLKSAVQAFVGNWEVMDAPIGNAEWSHDRLSLVFFDSTAAAQMLAGADAPANVFLQRGSNAWDEVINAANGLAPGSSTSIGAGVNEGMSKWKADSKNDLSMVVITDGKQNTAPLISPTGSGFLGLQPVAGLNQELRKRFIPIQTVGFGLPAQVDDDLLTNIAVETNGQSWLHIDGTTVFDTFANTLIAILKGNTASLAHRVHDTMNGPGPSTTYSVIVDRSPQRVVFSLQWAPPQRFVLDLDAFRPGALTPTAPSKSKLLPQATIKGYDTPAAGVWRAQVKRAAKGDQVNIPYTLNIMFLEKHLDYAFSLDAFKPVVGEKLGIRAVVDWDGKRLAGLPPGSIRARVFQQQQALGTILHDTKRSTNRVPSSIGGDPVSPLDAKLSSFEGRSLTSRIEQKEVAVVVLNEVAPGEYAATFDGTNIPGNYAFEVLMDWTNERTGRVHREERVEQSVRPRVDRAKTTIDTTLNANGTWTITMVPRDSFGNYFGPGYESLITARLLTSGGLRSPHPTDVNQIGAYSWQVSDTLRDQTPVLDIVVDGVPLNPRRE